MAISSGITKLVGCLIVAVTVLFVITKYSNESRRTFNFALQQVSTKDIEKEKMAETVREVWKECSIDKNSTCLPPFVKKVPFWLVSHEHKLATCKIEKVMSTFMTAATCYLNRTNEFMNAGREIHSETWYTRYCGGQIEYSNEIPVESLNEWTFLVIVRNPISRFISGWMDKCIYEHDKFDEKRCYSCHKNMTCFLDEFYRRAKNFMKKPFGPDFEQKHFLPQNWYCQFQDFSYNVVHYGDTSSERSFMSERIRDVLQTTPANQSQLDYIEKELNYKSPHATKKQTLKAEYLKELLQTPYLLRRFIQIFYYDFVMFGFPLPGY